VTERPGSAYLGPGKGRWTPTQWSDVVEAAAGGLLDESHWVDLKQELPTGNRTHNTELAKDLASLAVDGGLLLIGIEDHNSYAGAVRGVELARLADRVDQVARDRVRPSLVVRSHEICDPDRPGWGCLLIHQNRSPRRARHRGTICVITAMQVSGRASVLPGRSVRTVRTVGTHRRRFHGWPRTGHAAKCSAVSAACPGPR
jgi:hypothetical protein